MKITLDTNVWLSAIFWEGEANKLIEKAEQNNFEIIITKEILSEIIEVLNRESKFQKFIEDRKQNIEELTRTILSIATLIETKIKLDIIKEHPKDNIILEAAIDGKSRYILSYGKHLLNLIQFKKIRIMSPTEFMSLIKI